MSLMEWSDQFDTGIESIDSQHKQIMGYINQLHDAMMSGKGKEMVSPTLDSLISYTATHFAHEEKLFAAHNYANTNEHKEMHRKLVEQVVDFQKKFKAGELSLSTELMNFLRDWLMNHIVKEDMKYAPLFKEKGVK